MAASHPFTPGADDDTRCAHPLSDAPGYAGGTCGFPAANRRVHAPGAVTDRPQRHLAVVREDSATVAVGAPETSRAAARRTLPMRGSKRFEIVAMLAHPSRRDHGFTCDEVEVRTSWLHATTSSAFTGLTRDGIIRVLYNDEGETVTRPTSASGSPAAVYVLTEAGRAAYIAESASVRA